MSEQEKHLRTVRSFVRREGRSSSAQQKALEQLWPQFGLDYKKELVDLSGVFTNDNDIVLEIGFGMGASFCEMVQSSPETNFVGIEVHRPGVGAFLNSVQNAGCHNVKVVNHDAVDVLNHMVADDSLAKVQIFFPDPWPKKKHHKRRIIQKNFVEMVVKKLKTDGILHLSTDWENYAEHMLEVLEQEPGLKNSSGKGQFSPRPESRPLTKYEQRGQRLGHGVWDLVFFRSTTV